MTISWPSTASVVDTLRAAGCVYAEDEASMLLTAAESSEELDRMIRQRVSGLPLEQIVGWAAFCGLRILVEPDVFVPRRRTEFLAEQALKLTVPGSIAVELCCGAGAVSAVLLTHVPSIELYAADIERPAILSARRNLEPLGGRVFLGDLYDPLPLELQGRVDVLVANAPYVPTASIGLMPPEARLYEPKITLDGGADGLDVQRRIVATAPLWLAPTGALLIETSEQQAPTTAAIMTSAGLVAHTVRDEEREATVVIGRRPSGSKTA